VTLSRHPGSCHRTKAADDGEAVSCGDDGIASFNRIRYRRHDADVFLYAFDLIELDGDDLRREPLNVRKATLASVLARAAPGLQLNEHLEADGPDVFHHACMLGLEGIVSKFAVSFRSFAALDQEQEPERARGEARSGRGLGTMAVPSFGTPIDI
jgi:ATP-dependent DNA ligase